MTHDEEQFDLFVQIENMSFSIVIFDSIWYKCIWRI